MIQATHPISTEEETVVGPVMCERCAQAIELGEEPFRAEERGRVLAREIRRIMHLAIRFKSFEFVVECCQL